MFGKKETKDKEKKANERLVRKVLGKDSGRKTWGFPCPPDISARMKMLADQLQVPVYALTEHALQLSVGIIARMSENPEENQLVRQHILEVHVGRRTIEKISKHDNDMADVNNHHH
jgi:hypothetical protein